MLASVQACTGSGVCVFIPLSAETDLFQNFEKKEVYEMENMTKHLNRFFRYFGGDTSLLT